MESRLTNEGLFTCIMVGVYMFYVGVIVLLKILSYTWVSWGIVIVLCTFPAAVIIVILLAFWGWLMWKDNRANEQNYMEY